jgi:hypothetical protein
MGTKQSKKAISTFILIALVTKTCIRSGVAGAPSGRSDHCESSELQTGWSVERKDDWQPRRPQKPRKILEASC